MHTKRKKRGGQAVAKTETITVSTRFANNLRELAYLLDDKRPLAEFLDEHCGWVLTNLVEEKASTVGEWCDIISQVAPWKTEAECRTFVDRVRPKFEETAIITTTMGSGTSECLIPDTLIGTGSGLHCREHGIEFEEARKAFLRGELEKFLVSKGTIEPVAA